MPTKMLLFYTLGDSGGGGSVSGSGSGPMRLALN
jgi:hypothetical protein